MRTSIPAPAISPFSRASARAFSSTRPPLAVLTKNADFFIMPRLSAFIIFSLSFVRGQWSVTISEVFRSSSRLTAGVPSVIFWGERVKVMTFMPNALAISATFFPMSP